MKCSYSITNSNEWSPSSEVNRCKISGSHSGIHEEQGLLGYNATLIRKQLLTFL